MTDRQNNSINMFGATNEVLQTFKAVWQGRAPFAAQAKILADVISQLDDPLIARGRDTTGISGDKASYQLHAAAKADYIGDIIQAYALDHADQTLYRSMIFGAGEVVRMADAESHAKLLEVYNKGTELFKDLQNYGLEQDDLDTLKSDAGHFKEQMAHPRTAIGEKKEAGKSIDSLIRTANDALYRMDKMINTFTAHSPSFVGQYKSARNIVDRGGAKKAEG